MNEIREIRYEIPMSDVDFGKKTVFLAGPTVRGNQTHLKSWRIEAISLFKLYFDDFFKYSSYDKCLNLIIPEFSDITVSDKYRYDLPPWEFEGLRKCNVIMFWIPRTKELIGLTTNYELGYWTAKNRNKVVYGRPDNAYRINYTDIMWNEDGKEYCESQNFPIQNTLEKTVLETIKKLKEI